jgi:hypothetical protein
VVGLGKEINTRRVSMKKNCKEKYRLETTGNDGRIILKWFLKKWYGTSEDRIQREQYEIVNELLRPTK